jgi:hypothetical protein
MKPTLRAVVRLDRIQRKLLRHFLEKRTTAPEALFRAEILLQLDAASRQGRCSDDAVAHAAGASATTVSRLRQRFLKRGLLAALFPSARQSA